MYQNGASPPSSGARDPSVLNGYRNAPAPASATNAASTSVPPVKASRPGVRREPSRRTANRIEAAAAASTGGPTRVNATPIHSAGVSRATSVTIATGNHVATAHASATPNSRPWRCWARKAVVTAGA
jgi:hypothetical protein